MSDAQADAFWEKMDQQLESFVKELWKPLLEVQKGSNFLENPDSNSLDTSTENIEGYTIEGYGDYESDVTEDSVDDGMTRTYISFPKGTPEEVIKNVVNIMAMSGMGYTISVEGWNE